MTEFKAQGRDFPGGTEGIPQNTVIRITGILEEI
jgi:hypothetical protein